MGVRCRLTFKRCRVSLPCRWYNGTHNSNLLTESLVLSVSSCRREFSLVRIIFKHICVEDTRFFADFSELRGFLPGQSPYENQRQHQVYRLQLRKDRSYCYIISSF